MTTMRELSRWIRDYTQDPRHQQRLIAAGFIWYQMCVAMDIIDDAESALDAYIGNEFPTNTGGTVSSESTERCRVYSFSKTRCTILLRP